MPTRKFTYLLRFFAVVLGFSLAASCAQAHRGSDPVFSSPQPPAADAPLVAATGTVHELVVDNRVSNVRNRYLWLRLDDGSAVALRGSGLDALRDGDRVEATGRGQGRALFVTATRGLPPVPGSRARDTTAAQTASVPGRLAVVHADYFSQGRGEYQVVVRSDDGRVTSLILPNVPDVLEIGMSVIAEGRVATDGVSLEASSITVLALPEPSARDLAQAPITNNVLVILIKFTDSPAGDPFTPAAVQQVMVTNTNSVANYYNEVSYGQQLLNVTVTSNWLQANAATPAGCNYTTIASLGDSAATAAGYVVSSYRNRFYVMPYNAVCGWAGLGYVGAPYQAWSNGYNQLGVYGHELGHNFTLWHAGSLTCSGQVIGGSCGVAEYGDPFDIMGNIGTMHFNAAQKSALNWIPASSVRTHTSGTATYTLSPLESPGQTTYAVKIPAAANRTYWIEYRQPIGFDIGMASYPNNGAQIRVASPLQFPCTNCGGDDTEILDMTLGTPGTFGDAALLVGQTYIDSTYGISVQVLSATASALTLSVSAPGGTAATTTTLTSSANPSTVGVNVTFTATVNGNAPTGSVNFKDGGASISGCAAATVTGGGNSRTATCATSNLSLGAHSVVASYSGDAANTSSNSIALSQLVNPSAQTNVALASNGGVASASSTYSNAFPVSPINNNERAGINWGNGGGWADATANNFPDWVQINFSGSKTIDHVVVYTVQDNWQSPVEPTDTMTFTLWGLTDFTVQGWNGSAWVTLGTVSGNNLVKRTVYFTAYTTDRIRINVTNALNAYSRITEVEAWGN